MSQIVCCQDIDSQLDYKSKNVIQRVEELLPILLGLTDNQGSGDVI